MKIQPEEYHKYFINREISWLNFNERVLQEAQDKSVPLLQRLRFLGIFSNNLDEFFRVRVATIRRMATLKPGKIILGDKPTERILEEINEIVQRQQGSHQRTYNAILNELRKHNIFIINEKELNTEQETFIENYFRNNVNQAIVPIMIQHTTNFPYLKDESLYFAIELIKTSEPAKKEYALIEADPDMLPRFVELPGKSRKKQIIIIDDVIRYCLPEIFNIFEFDEINAHTIKLTRDAELDIDDDISKSFMEKMSISIQKRKKGAAIRFVYDKNLPMEFLKFLMRKMKTDKHDNVIAGGRYHNFKDYINFPDLKMPKLENKPAPPLSVKAFSQGGSILSVIKEKDRILHYPYQSFNHFIDLFREAAIDPYVTKIELTMYRVAKRSRIVNALINAARNGKDITVVIELQARFDERANIRWSNKMQDEGIHVIHGVTGLKVHCKMALIERKENGRPVHYAYIGTGNPHEGTAKIYGDEALFTADKRITHEVANTFDFFRNNYKKFTYKHLVLSPYSTRNHFYTLIDNEIRNAQKRKKAYMIVKLNSLVDEEMMSKLYEASQAGVKIKLIIRGICSLIPGVPGLSENIEAISIVDKYLEHSRIIVFCNGGDELYYISSADWMNRNLDTRIEVTCPVYDKDIQDELRKMLDIQLKDNVKARLHAGNNSNTYKKTGAKRKIRAQVAYYNYLKNRCS